MPFPWNRLVDGQPAYETFERLIMFVLTLVIVVLVGFAALHLVVGVVLLLLTIVRVRSIILIGMLATVRKFIVLDLASVDAPELFAVSAAILALGVVYWLVRDQDRRAMASK